MDGKESFEEPVAKREYGLDTVIFLAILVFGIYGFGSIMGVGPMFKTILNTAYKVLLETTLFVCAMCVVMGAFGALLTEFGVVALAQYLLSPLMRPLYGLPGAAAIGVVTTFLSDNAAILALAQSPRTRKYFQRYQTPALCNIGTAFGMGLIVCTFMLGLGTDFVGAIGAGFFGCFVASIFSTRSMLYLTKRRYVREGLWECMQEMEDVSGMQEEQGDAQVCKVKKKSVFGRVMDAILEGGKLGWQICFATTPGVVCICTLVMMLTFGPSEDANGIAIYTGGAYEGIAILPRLGDFLSPITDVLFGFRHGSNIAIPITSLGAVGAVLGMLPKMVANGLVGANEIAVFTAMGMCWSGYLSTHISMMDALGRRELIPIALGTHSVAGLVAGTVAHYAFLFMS